MNPSRRQLLVALSSQVAALSVGGSVVFPTQLLQKLKANDTTILLDMNTSSWIGSVYGLAGIPVIFLPILMQWKGRKLAHIIICSFITIGWALALFANSITLFLISEAFQGLGTNGLLPVCCLSMTEMLAPKYRFISMQLLGVTMSVGMVMVGILGRFVHTKVISFVMVIPAVIAIIMSLFWSESPSWLACKRKFEKCETTFILLRGVDEASKSELKNLIAAHRENFMERKSRPTAQWFWKEITSRDFYMPSIHMFILMNLLYGSGGDVVLIYFLELVEKSSHNKDAVFYAGILLYMIVFVGCIITNITIGYFNNKTVLLSSTLGVIASLMCASVIAYLQNIGVVADNSLFFMYCLIGFMTSNSLGMNALVFYLGAELMPVKHRSLGGALYTITNCGLYALTLKLSPYLMEYVGMWGTFLMFTTNAIVCALYVWRKVPETKGRTLQELEDFYTNGRFVERLGSEALLKSPS